VTRRSLAAAIVLAVVASTGAFVGIIATIALIEDNPPKSLTASTGPTYVTTTLQSFADPRDIVLQLQELPEVKLASQSAGTITTLDCTPGGTWASGASNLAVNGQPILNLHTSTPLWRPVGIGAKGPDVDALKAEIARLGKSATSGKVFQWKDLQSFRELKKEVGASADGDEVTPGEILWLSAPSITLGACDARLGKQIASGDPLAAVRFDPTFSIDGSALPQAFEPRVLTVGNVSLEMSSNTELRQPKRIREVLQTSVYRAAAEQAKNSDGLVSLKVTASLATPVQVIAVPPSAVTASAGSDACIESDSGDIVRVSVVSSELGRSLISVPDAAIPDKVAVEGPAECS